MFDGLIGNGTGPETPRQAGERGFWVRLERMDTPALFLWGDRDRLVPAGFARHVERVLPEARSHVLSDCGHVPQFELPGPTHELLTGFLRDVA